MDGKIVSENCGQLRTIEVTQRVAIPLAIESGSRAWGFPSPDSDYDCRFIYVPHIDDALGLFARRDVIEMPLTPVFDINGWELRKAIKLMLKGNAVVIEWLNSPIVYQRNEAFVLDMLALGETVFQRGTMANHYRRIMKGQMEGFANLADVPLKKVFYALRSALAIRFLAVNRTLNGLPMRMQDLCDGAAVGAKTRAEIDALIAEKAVTGELGRRPLPATFASLINEAETQAMTLSAEAAPLQASVLAGADRVYLQMLRTYAPS